MATLDVTIIDINEDTIRLTGDDTKFIRYHSEAQAAMELNGGVMNLDFCAISNGNQRIYRNTGVFKKIESERFSFSCADADNNTYTEVVSVPMVEYVKLTCNIDQKKIDGNGNINLSCRGICFGGSFGKITNTIHAQCRYRVKGTSSYSGWHDMDVSTYSTHYLADADIDGLNHEQTYEFQVHVYDELEDITATAQLTSMPIFHWSKSDFAFEVPVTAESIKLEKKGASYGVGGYLRFGDADNCYIAEKADDIMTIYANTSIHLLTNLGKVYINDAVILNGSWTPSLSSGAVSGYSERQGWYSKIGNVVSVGFYIKATCNSGYNDEAIEIQGLPFTPSVATAGGGMCSGACVSSGKNFQCFVAETDGTITTRVQDCNSTSTANISTSAIGCYYRKSGGELTLSGTITYTTEE